jgi:hypothetical protein
LAQQRHRDLALVRESGGSPRFFDVALRAERARAAGAPMLFETAPLNRIILIKHTLRAHEREDFATKRRTVTKLIFPINLQDLSMGGYAQFVEEPGFERRVGMFLSDARGVDGLRQDIEKLKLFAEAPMFDPYLLRERFRLSGFNADPHWFALHPDRERKLTACIYGHIRDMFWGATKDRALAEKFADGFCHKVFSGDFKDYAAELNEFFGLDTEAMVEALLAWKAFLYQRLVFGELQGRLFGELQGRLFGELNLLLDAPPLEEISDMDAVYIKSVQDRLRIAVRDRYGAVLLALGRYNTAYTDFARRGRPSSFMNFLRDSPRAAFDLGENIALLMHYGGLLAFRIEQEAALHAAGSAIELHQDLAASLDSDADRQAALNLAAV